jgi:hypothetical protein
MHHAATTPQAPPKNPTRRIPQNPAVVQRQSGGEYPHDGSYYEAASPVSGLLVKVQCVGLCLTFRDVVLRIAGWRSAQCTGLACNTGKNGRSMRADLNTPSTVVVDRFQGSLRIRPTITARQKQKEQESNLWRPMDRRTRRAFWCVHLRVCSLPDS